MDWKEGKKLPQRQALHLRDSCLEPFRMGQMATRTWKGLGVLRTVTIETHVHGASSAQEVRSPPRLYTPGGLSNLNPAVKMMVTAASKYVFALFFRHEVLLGCQGVSKSFLCRPHEQLGLQGQAI